MRFETKKTFEKRIAELEDLLAEEKEHSHRQYLQSKANERAYVELRDAKQRTVRALEWSVEQALMARQADVVGMARQIADFVYGPEIDESP